MLKHYNFFGTNVTNTIYERSADIGNFAWKAFQYTLGNYSAPPSETVVALQGELGILKERCRLQEKINLLNDEFIQLILQKHTYESPEIKLIEMQLQQYQEELESLIFSDCRDCSSTDAGELQQSLDSQSKHLKGLLEVANEQSQYHWHLVDNGEKLIHNNHLEIGLFKPEKSCLKSDVDISTSEGFFGLGYK